MCNVSQYKKTGLGKKLFAWMFSKSGKIQDKIYGDRKEELFRNLSGKVLEIGPGTGVNFSYFPKNIEWIGVEPNPAMQKYLKKTAKKENINATFISGEAEYIPLPDESIDYVISTLVLCSVNSQNISLSEIKRVLKPGGKFIFIEHIGAPSGTRTRKFQEFVKPAWMVLGDGCNPALDTGIQIKQTGFSDIHYEDFSTKGLFGFKIPHIAGVAIK